MNLRQINESTLVQVKASARLEPSSPHTGHANEFVFIAGSTAGPGCAEDVTLRVLAEHRAGLRKEFAFDC